MAYQASAQVAETAAQRPTEFLERRIWEGLYLEQFVVQAMTPFREADVDANGLDAIDVARRQSRIEAAERAQNIARVLRYDLDGDLVVTPDEVAAFSSPKAETEALRKDLERFDVDGDGRITLNEVREASARISNVNRSRQRDETLDMLKLPQVRNGRLSAAGLEEAVKQVFARADLDGDGRISRDEYKQFHSALPPERPLATITDVYCPMAPARVDELIVLLGSYEGFKEPGSRPQAGKATVEIEPGRRPIYLVLPSYEAIGWTLTGSVGRVRHVVLSSYDKDDAETPQGVNGVAPQRVKVFGSQGCIPHFTKADSIEATLADTSLGVRLGRRADMISGAYTARTFKIPAIAPANVEPQGRPRPASNP